MNKKIVQSVCLLLPAVVMGIACILGLSLHPADIIIPENTAEASRISSELTETTQTDSFSTEQTSLSESSDTPKTEISQAASSKPDRQQESSSKNESSQVQEKPIQQSTPKAEISQENKSEETQISEISSVPTQTSMQEESSHTLVQETSQVQPSDVSKTDTAKPSQTPPEQSSIQEVSRAAEPSHPESTQASSNPVQESSIQPIIKSEESEESSTVSEEPTGKYTDGTYQSTAEVDGMEEEGFLYDLEITVTISGGEIISISGKIKNDRSEDPSSNEAYVKRAVKKLSDSIIANQEINGVDVISNATYSSNAVLKATAEALAQAER